MERRCFVWLMSFLNKRFFWWRFLATFSLSFSPIFSSEKFCISFIAKFTILHILYLCFVNQLSFLNSMRLIWTMAALSSTVSVLYLCLCISSCGPWKFTWFFACFFANGIVLSTLALLSKFSWYTQLQFWFLFYWKKWISFEYNFECVFSMKNLCVTKTWQNRIFFTAQFERSWFLKK